MAIYEVLLTPESNAVRWSNDRYPYYYPLHLTDDATDWLVQNIEPDCWKVADASMVVPEQGEVLVRSFEGLRVFFSSADDAVRFKLTWA